MSDFDKEAEREKLREKYERDEADREATRRMSDLLLKGATMTNTHCGTCGDPLFRQDGVTFCPTCHGSPEAVEGPDLESGSGDVEAEPSAADGSAPEEAGAAADDGGAATDAGADTVADARAEGEGADREPTPAAARAADDLVDAAPADARTVDGRDPRRRERGPDRRDVHGAGAPGVSDDLAAGRDALAAALERFAREAAATDDPRHAKECLEAAREASEALAALR